MNETSIQRIYTTSGALKCFGLEGGRRSDGGTEPVDIIKRRENNPNVEISGDDVSDTGDAEVDRRKYARVDPEEATESNVLEEELESKQSDTKDCPSFNPALYIQRYLLVADTVVELCDKAIEEGQTDFKILDLGCANCSLFVYMKNALSEKTVSVEYIAVDKDRVTLEMDAKSAVEPGVWDYVKQRSGPISVQVLEGDILVPDPRIANADVLIMVEVIEHLPLDIVESKLADVIFGSIRPKDALLTTPNFEFNILFQDFKEGKCKFRHWDHKFEWTRDEFETWCNTAAERYNYSVFFIGIGSPPQNRTEVGCCTQMAHFTRKSDINGSCEADFVGNYETIKAVKYIWKKPPSPMERLSQNIKQALEFYNRSAQEEIDPDFDYRISCEEEEVDKAEQRPSFPISALASYIEHMDEEKGHQLIRDIAVGVGFKLSADNQRILCCTEDDSVDESPSESDVGAKEDKIAEENVWNWDV